MRIVFAGSAQLGCPALETLARDAGHTVAGVITQPDRPKGRHLRVSLSAVHSLADKHGIPVLTPGNVNSPESLSAIREMAPDILVVIAYGQFLKTELLALPPDGCVNLHASLLPAYRGAAPIQWSIANGETQTGVTVMYMNEKMDAGDIIMQRTVDIGAHDTAGSLHDRLALVGAPLLIDALDAVSRGNVTRVPQDESRVSLARKLRKADGRIDWSRPACELYNHVRGFDPWPSCYCVLPSRRSMHRTLKVLQTKIEAGVGRPGEVIECGETGPLIATGDCALRLVEVQPEGKRRMAGADFLHGHRLERGDFLL